MRAALRAVVALVGGFGLSFVALGVLWIGVRPSLQLLMAIPFLLLAFAVTRTGESADRVSMLIVLGAAPLGWMLTLFRDKNDSHLMSILAVCAWLAGTLAGTLLGARRLPRNQPAP